MKKREFLSAFLIYMILLCFNNAGEAKMSPESNELYNQALKFENQGRY